MPPIHATLSFLTDYGLDDEFVGVVKSVIRSIAPEVVVVDITHQIPPHDVRAGGLALARSAQYLCPGIVLAVVDPGVGTARRPIAVEVGGGQSLLVGPDNGLLAPAVALCGGATRAVVLDDPAYHLESPGGTFDGRDVFGPVAAHLCNGVPLEAVGTPVEPGTLVPGILPVSRMEQGRIVAEVLWVDRFGNCQLNVDADELASLCGTEPVTIRYGDQVRRVAPSRTFDEVPADRPGIVVDSYGLHALVVRRGSASAELGIGPGTEVTLEPAAGEPAGSSVAVRAPSRGRRLEDTENQTDGATTADAGEAREAMDPQNADAPRPGADGA